MSTKIITLDDGNGNILCPTTLEQAIFDDSGVRLDNKLNSLSTKFPLLSDGIEIVANSDLNNPMYREIGTYFCKSIAIADTILNKPPFEYTSAFTMKVYYGTGDNYPIQEINISSARNVFRRVYDPYTDKYGNWIRDISTTDIVQSDTVGGVDKIPSAEVTKALNNKKLNYIVVNNGTDLNTIGAGLFVGQGFLNAPTNEWYTILATNISHAGSQLAMNINNGRIYSRSMGSGKWEGWLMVSNPNSWIDVTSEFPLSGNITPVTYKVLYNPITNEIDYMLHASTTAQFTLDTWFQVATYPTKYYPVNELFGDICGFCSTAPYFYELRIYRSTGGFRIVPSVTLAGTKQIRINKRWICG